MNGESNGYGKYIYADGAVYEGEFKNNMAHGKGKMTDADGETYEGEFKEGERHGRGKCVLPDGTVQDGYFENGEFAGAAESAYEVDEEMDISPEVLEQFKQSEAVPTSQPAAKDTNKEIWDMFVKMRSTQKKNEFLASHPVMVVPEGTKKIGQNVFYNCSNLKEIHFNQGLVEIGGWAFYGCVNLGPVVTIPKGVKKICSGAFEGCSSIKKVVLPNHVLVERMAFVCGVTEVEFETDPPYISLMYSSFKDCDKNMTKEMKKKIKDAGANAFK